MRSIVAFLIEEDGNTDDLSAIIENTCSNYKVIDHEVRVDVMSCDDLNHLLSGLTWDERAKVDTLTHLISELNDWAVHPLLIEDAIAGGNAAIRALHQRVIDEANAL